MKFILGAALSMVLATAMAYWDAQRFHPTQMQTLLASGMMKYPVNTMMPL